MMQTTYRLAVEKPFHLVPFGPAFTLPEAQQWQAQLAKAGKPVLVVNVESQ